MEERVGRELGLSLVTRLAGGEHGAFAVTTSDGTPLVLKVFARPDAPRLDRAIDVATRVRLRGVPVPDPYWVGTTDEWSYTLQQHCSGEVPPVLKDAHAEQLLAHWNAHLGAAPSGDDWPEAAIRALRIGDPALWAEHAPVRAAGGEAAELLDEIIDVGDSGDPALLHHADAMHGDWHHRNLLVLGDRVSTVFDWEAARPGDARYDLVYLNFWCAAFDGSEVAPAAVARVRAATDTLVDPGARRLLAALVALHQLWFTSAHRPERLPRMIKCVHLHLAPWWRNHP